MGNFNKLQRAREQSFYADAALNLARAEQAQRAARERLTRLLGLWGAQTAFTLPERLPDLPDTAREQPDIERVAMAQRLDVQGAKLAAEQTAQQPGPDADHALRQRARARRACCNTFNDAPSQRGWEIGFELPLFDWGDARVATAEADLHAGAAPRRARPPSTRAPRCARPTPATARPTTSRATTATRSCRCASSIAEENLLRYNGMLIGVFELLADARAQIASVNGAIEALRDFWLAQADLDMALIGKPSLTRSPPAPRWPPKPAAAGH